MQSGEPPARPRRGSLSVLLLLGLLAALALYSRLVEEKYARYDWAAGEDFYAALEAAPAHSPAQLRQSYRRLIRRFHPDRNPGCADCVQRSVAVQRAWETLGDAQRRAAYDETNSAEFVRSRAVELTAANARRFLAAEHNVVVVQVYEHGDAACRALSGAWEGALAAFPFVDFARLNRRSQGALLRLLPFGVREVPFVLAVGPGLSPQFADLDFRGDNALPLRRFVAALFPPLADGAAPPRRGVALALRQSAQSVRARYFGQRFAALFAVELRLGVAGEGQRLSLFGAGAEPLVLPVESSPSLLEAVELLLFERLYAPAPLTRENYQRFCRAAARACLLGGEELGESSRRGLAEDLRAQIEVGLAGRPFSPPPLLLHLAAGDHPRLAARLSALSPPPGAAFLVRDAAAELTVRSGEEETAAVPFERFLREGEFFEDLLRSEHFSPTKAFLRAVVGLLAEPKLLAAYACAAGLALRRGGGWPRAVAAGLLAAHLCLALREFRCRFQL